MSIGLRYFILIFTGLISTLNSYAQLSADFSGNTQQGCSPLVVSFSDQSSGGTITYREWTFGNGNTSIGNNASPSATYVNGGSYTVTLLVANATDTATVSKSNFITVFDNPIPDFSFSPSTGCVPELVSFTDLSIVPIVGLNTYTWDFGDGSPTVNAFNPSHSYQTPGTFTVTLSIIDANGCTAAKDSIGIITIDPKPIADFTTSGPRASCTAPLTVNYINNSTGSNLNYNWFFDGGGGSSTQTNPTINYTQTGQFYVRLIVTTQTGCADTSFKPNYISILPTNADFLVADTVCVGDSVAFQNLSVGAIGYQWNFGNGLTSTLENPKTFYATPGTYPITLIASDPPNCQDTKLGSVHVEAVNANFTVDSNFACSVPFTVTYQDQSTGNIANWKWVLDDQDPLIPPQIGGGPNPQRTFFTDVVTTDKLIVTTASGCKDSITFPNYIQVAQPQVSFAVDKVTGCAPLKVNFSNTATSVDSIVDFNWAFDTLGTSLLLNDSFTFQFPGTFNVCLKATTQLGCRDSMCVPIKAGEAPIISFMQEKDTTCAGNTVQFRDKSTDSTKTDFWSWNFGDNTPPETSKGPRHKFNDVGWIPLEYIVGIGGCFDTVLVDSVIYVKGPIAEAQQASYSCQTPLTYNLSGTVTAGNRFMWDFGDSTGFDSLNINTTYTYQNSGNYKVIFTAFNDSTGCEFSEELNVQPRLVKAKFTIQDSLACAGGDVFFDGLVSEDEKSLSYRWQIGNGNNYPFTAKPPVQKFNTGGVYQNRLIVEDVNGCKDTIIKPLRVFEVDAKFSMSSSAGCSPLQVNFTDQTNADTTINNRIWDFGTGDSLFSQNPSFSFLVADSLQNLSGNTISDTFFVRKIVEDTLGCRGSYLDTVIVYKYISNTNVSDSNICVGEAIQFIDSITIGNLNNTWFFGNGDSLIGNPVSYNYPISGNFKPYLKRTEQGGGCINIDSLQKVNVQLPIQPKFYANYTDTNCFPAQILFVESTPDSNIVTRTWRFQQGGNPISIANDSAITTYNNPGEFNVTLITTTSNGCVDSLTKNSYINIRGPSGTFIIEPDTACKNDVLTFSVKNAQNVGSVFFDFGDGFNGSITFPDTSIVHQYKQIGALSPVVIIDNPQGTCPKTDILSLFIYEVTGGMKFLSDSISCPPFASKFIDLSKGNDRLNYLLNGLPFNYTADSTLSLPDAGNYELFQIVSDSATGCIDTVSRNIVVHPLPEILGFADTTICENDTLNVQLSGALRYKWQPFSFIENDSLATNKIYPPNAQNYRVIGTDANSCSSTIQITVSIQFDYNFDFSADTSIYQGEIVQLTGLADVSANYSWSPFNGLDCDDCPLPMAQPLVTTTYSLSLADPFNCFPKDSSVNIEVIEALSVDLPNTFTPNGDGINDIIYAKGWGIESILEFKIFNRWGEIVFETNDVNEGWDGTYKGVPQEIDAYAYLIRAVGYNGEEEAKKGFINLKR